MECRLVNVATEMDEMYPLRDGITTLGRESDNDIQLIATNISRHHATLTNMPNVCQLEDIGSANGTFVNGDRIKSIVLKNGDEISFADQIFRFESTGSVGADDAISSQRDYSPRTQAATVRIQQRMPETRIMSPVATTFSPLKRKK
jgi:pSer/pThr/pTyr-binding forkhead associated (FHA) protein